MSYKVKKKKKKVGKLVRWLNQQDRMFAIPAACTSHNPLKSMYMAFVLARQL